MSKILVDSIKPNFGDTITLDGNVEITGVINFDCNKIVTVTYESLKFLMQSCTLCPGTTYRITGFNKNMFASSVENPYGYLPEILYDDGTNGGITIYMKALTKCDMATEGYGEFWNPNYYGDEDYFNLDKTGGYGIWDGDNPIPSNVVLYNVDDVVFWGGYAWLNKTGNVGFSINSFELSSPDWEKIPYSDIKIDGRVIYKKVIDEVTVDWYYGIVVERHDVKNQVRVIFTPDTYMNFHRWQFNNQPIPGVPFSGTYYINGGFNPISAIPWGLSPDLKKNRLQNSWMDNYETHQKGMQAVYITNSYADFINFKGHKLINVVIINSMVYDNYFGRMTKFQQIFCDDMGVIRANTAYNNDLQSQQANWYFDIEIKHFSGMSENTLRDYSRIQSVSIDFLGRLFNNDCSGSSNIFGNSIANNSAISNNNITQGSFISNNVVNNLSYITVNDVLESSSISANIVQQGSFIRNCILSQSALAHNKIEHVSDLRNITCVNSQFSYSILHKSLWNFQLTGTINNKIISYLKSTSISWTNSLASAIDIFYNTEKRIFKRLDGTNRMEYFNTNDTPIIVDIDA